MAARRQSDVRFHRGILSRATTDHEVIAAANTLDRIHSAANGDIIVVGRDCSGIFARKFSLDGSPIASFELNGIALINGPSDGNSQFLFQDSRLKSDDQLQIASVEQRILRSEDASQ